MWKITQLFAYTVCPSCIAELLQYTVLCNCRLELEETNRRRAETKLSRLVEELEERERRRGEEERERGRAPKFGKIYTGKKNS